MKTTWIHNDNFKVTKDMVIDGMMIKQIPDIINKRFDCIGLGLTTLKNCPKIINGNFNCNDNLLTSLEFGPEKVIGYYSCVNNKFSNLEFSPEKIKGFFDCSRNKITTLKGSPKEIIANFYCSFNKLTNLEYCPEISKGFVILDNNVFDLTIEYSFILKGYTNYWPDLLRYCIDEKIKLKKIKGWPKGFLTDETVKSAKGMIKFDL